MQVLVAQVLRGQADGRAWEASTPVADAPPRAKCTRSTPVPQPTSSTRRPRGAGEFDQPLQVVQLLEVILIEIGEEAGRPDLVPRDREIVDVRVPVRAHAASKARIVAQRCRSRHATIVERMTHTGRRPA